MTGQHRKGVTERVWTCRLGDSGLQCGLSDRLLQHGFVEMVPLSQPGLAIKERKPTESRPGMSRLVATVTLPYGRAIALWLEEADMI